MHFRSLRRVALVATAVLASPPAHRALVAQQPPPPVRPARDTSATAGTPRPLSLDEAMKIAERVPVAKHGTVEIRPVLEISGLPA